LSSINFNSISLQFGDFFGFQISTLKGFTQPHQGWIAAKAYWPAKENKQHISKSTCSPAHTKTCRYKVLSTVPTNVGVVFLYSLGPCQHSGMTDAPVVYFVCFLVSSFLDFQTAPGKLSDTNLTHPPMHRGIKDVARCLCYDLWMASWKHAGVTTGVI